MVFDFDCVVQKLLYGYAICFECNPSVSTYIKTKNSWTAEPISIKFDTG
jgi:hypothetical protein